MTQCIEAFRRQLRRRPKLDIVLRRYWELAMGAAVLVGSFVYQLALDLEYAVMPAVP